MTTSTSTTAVADVALWLYPGQGIPHDQLPVITVSDPVNGVWTITAPDTVSQADLDAAVALQVSSITTQTNHDSLWQKAKNAIANNLTYLGIAAPTNAQVVAQVRALTKQVDALIKLQTSDLANTDGT